MGKTACGMSWHKTDHVYCRKSDEPGFGSLTVVGGSRPYLNSTGGPFHIANATGLRQLRDALTKALRGCHRREVKRG